MPETKLDIKITRAILDLSAHKCFCRKITHIMLSWSAWANIVYNTETATKGAL